MIIRIPAKPVEKMSFDFEAEAKQFLPERVKSDNLIKIAGELNKIDGGWKATGSIKYGFEYNCDSCTKPSKYSKTINFDEVYLVNNNEDQYHFDSNEIDLTQLVIDAIVLDMPTRLLCNTDCQGLCPVCKKDKNKNRCGCSVDEEKNNPFNILKDMEVKNNGTTEKKNIKTKV